VSCLVPYFLLLPTTHFLMNAAPSELFWPILVCTILGNVCSLLNDVSIESRSIITGMSECNIRYVYHHVYEQQCDIRLSWPCAWHWSIHWSDWSCSRSHWWWRVVVMGYIFIVTNSIVFDVFLTRVKLNPMNERITYCLCCPFLIHYFYCMLCLISLYLIFIVVS
jgi:hypothetical protein